MEVDPNTGYLYVVDTGIVGGLSEVPVSNCPAKIVVYDLNHASSRSGYRVVKSYTIPDDVIDRNNSHSVLSSIALDYKYPHADKVRSVGHTGSRLLGIRVWRVFWLYDYIRGRRRVSGDLGYMLY